MRKALQNNKRPYISIKNLNIPQNRINQNGLLEHPSELIDAYKKKHKRKHPHQEDCSLLKIFKHTQPFKLTNSTLPTSFVKKLLSKKVAAWASQQLKFHPEAHKQNNSYNNTYYNSLPGFGAYSSSNFAQQGYPYPPNQHHLTGSYPKSSLHRFPGQIYQGRSVPQFTSGYRQSYPRGGSAAGPNGFPPSQAFVSKKVDLKTRLTSERPFRNRGSQPGFGVKEQEEKVDMMISLRKRVNSSSKVEIDLQNLSDDESSLLVRRKRLKTDRPAKEARSKSASRFDKRKFGGLFMRRQHQTAAYNCKNQGFSVVKSSSFSSVPPFHGRSSFMKDKEINLCDVSKLENLSVPKISKSSTIMKNTRDILNSNLSNNQNLKIFMSK